VTPTTDFGTILSKSNVRVSVYKLTDYNLTYNSTSLDVSTVLSSFSNIGTNNVIVSGSIAKGFTVQFINKLANKTIDTIEIESKLVDSHGETVNASVNAITLNQDESVFISDAEKRALVTAVDQIRPTNSYPTYNLGRSKFQNQSASSVVSSSDYYEVIRCVTGTEKIAWPSVDSIYWIEKGIEKEAPRVHNDLQQHYHNFHKPSLIYTYGASAVSDSNYTTSGYKDVIKNTANLSQHGGNFNPEFQKRFNLQNDVDKLYTKELALPTFSEPPLVTTQANYSGIQFINGIYPMGDKLQPVLDQITKYTEPNQFWASTQRSSGSEYLEIDLGSPKAINFLSFETIESPMDIEISYDLISNGILREFVPVTPEDNFPFESSLHANDSLNQAHWHYATYSFTDNYKEVPFARFVRIKFTRRTNATDQFLPLKSDGSSNEWPILVKNLRIGRNV